ncbi:MAG: GIY-YIG nuclease family protein [Pseudomonadota bacterium]
MYVTYGIIDPKTLKFVYVGQSKNFERRKAEHLSAHRLRERLKKDDIRYWLRKTLKAKLEPIFVILDDYTETEDQSIASEREWVQRLSEAGYPLYNRWEEHRALIDANLKAQTLPDFEALIFVEKKGQRIGTCKPNRKGTGYRITLAKGVTLKGQTIELIPPKDTATADE